MFIISYPVMIRTCTLTVLILASLTLANRTKLLDNYRDNHQAKFCATENGTSYVILLIKEIIKIYLKDHTIVLLYDELYLNNFHYQNILNELIEVTETAFRRGVINTTLPVPRISPKTILTTNENRNMAFIVFTKDLETAAYAIGDDIEPKVKTVLIPQATVYAVKEFLQSTTSQRFINLIVAVDPALKIDRYTQALPKKGKECDIVLYTHNIFQDFSGLSTPRVLTAWRKHRFTRFLNLFPDKFQAGLNGYHLTVASSEVPPNVFRKRNVEGEESLTTTWDGMEVRLLKAVAEMINFTVEYTDIIDDTNNDVAEMAIKEVEAKRAKIALGGIYLTYDRLQRLDFSQPHFQDCASFVTQTSTALPKYRAIMGPFLWEVWLTLVAAYLFAIIPIAFSLWHSLNPLIDHPSEIENMFWYVFGTFTNCFTFSGANSWTQAEKYATKMFIATYWVFTIIITACYTGSIIAFITLPVFPKVIDSSRQLIEEDFIINGLATGGWKRIFTEADDSVARTLSKSYQTVPTVWDGLRNVSKSRHAERKITFFGSARLLEYIMRVNYTPEEENKRLVYHQSPECFTPLLASFGFPRKTPFIDKFNKALEQLSQAGFLQKVTREVEWEIYRTSNNKILQPRKFGRKLPPEDRELTLDDTQGMFLLLGAGFAIAFAALAGEILHWAVSEVRNRKFGEPTLSKRALDEVHVKWRRFSDYILRPVDRQISALQNRRRDSRVSDVFGERIKAPTPFSLSFLFPERLNKKSVRPKSSDATTEPSMDFLQVPTTNDRGRNSF